MEDLEEALGVSEIRLVTQRFERMPDTFEAEVIFFQRSAKSHRADGLACLFFKTGLQGSKLVRLFGDEFLKSLMVALVQGGRAITARLVDQPIEA